MLRCVRTNRPVVPSKPAATIMAVRARSMSIAEDIASIPSVRQTPRRRPRGARLSDEDVPAAAERDALSTLATPKSDGQNQKSITVCLSSIRKQFEKLDDFRNPTVSSVQRKYRARARPSRSGRGEGLLRGRREKCAFFFRRVLAFASPQLFAISRRFVSVERVLVPSSRAEHLSLIHI